MEEKDKIIQLDDQVKKKLLTLQDKHIWKNKIKINHFKAPDQFQRQHYFIRFFSNLVGEEGPRIPGVKDSRVCFLGNFAVILYISKQSPYDFCQTFNSFRLRL